MIEAKELFTSSSNFQEPARNPLHSGIIKSQLTEKISQIGEDLSTEFCRRTALIINAWWAS